MRPRPILTATAGHWLSMAHVDGDPSGLTDRASLTHRLKLTPQTYEAAVSATNEGCQAAAAMLDAAWPRPAVPSPSQSPQLAGWVTSPTGPMGLIKSREPTTTQKGAEDGKLNSPMAPFPRTVRRRARHEKSHPHPRRRATGTAIWLSTSTIVAALRAVTCLGVYIF